MVYAINTPRNVLKVNASHRARNVKTTVSAAVKSAIDTQKSVQRATASQRPKAVEKTKNAAVKSAISTPRNALTVNVSH